jgi:hypothetical protein
MVIEGHIGNYHSQKTIVDRGIYKVNNGFQDFQYNPLLHALIVILY